MELKIAYCYNQKFLPTNRHKKLRERQIKDILKVNITELSSDIFPVAFIIHDLQSVQDGMTSYEDYKSEKCEYRMFPLFFLLSSTMLSVCLQKKSELIKESFTFLFALHMVLQSAQFLRMKVI